jgi:hypothetical protein
VNTSRERIPAVQSLRLSTLRVAKRLRGASIITEKGGEGIK